MEENKTNMKIFAEALVRIIENQIKIEKHIGLVRDEFEDCYYDREVIDNLNNIE